MTPEQAWFSLDGKTRLLVTEFIFENLASPPDCSFMGLLRNRLRLNHPGTLQRLIHVGGQEINNALSPMRNEYAIPIQQAK